jgi:hypothetical protein
MSNISRASIGAVLVLALVLVTACANTDELEQQVADLRQEVEQEKAARMAAEEAGFQQMAAAVGELSNQPPGVQMLVEPAIFEYPEGRIRTRNAPGTVWVFGSGLQPGQWFELTVQTQGNEIPLSFPGDFVRRASADGTFAATLSEFRHPFYPLHRDGGGPGGIFTFLLRDSDTGALLASTPWAVCGIERENPWCSAAKATAKISEE